MTIHLTFIAWVAGAAGLACLGVILARVLAWVSARGELRLLHRRHTVIAEYNSPKQLSPAELGYVADATFGTDELLATIAQLYAKGAVQLAPLGTNDFSIVAVNDEVKRDVDDCEASVLGYLRTMLRSQTTWHHLASLISDVAGLQSEFEDAAEQSLVGKGLLDRYAVAGVLFHRRVAARIVATIGCVVVVLPIYQWGHASLAAASLNAGYSGIDRGIALILLLPVAVLVWFCWLMYANVLAYIYFHRAGIPLGATDELRSLWADVVGFRLFLQETEYVRLQHDQSPKDPAMAYCLALGLDPGFVRSL